MTWNMNTISQKWIIDVVDIYRPYWLLKNLASPQQFPNRIFNFGTLWYRLWRRSLSTWQITSGTSWLSLSLGTNFKSSSIVSKSFFIHTMFLFCFWVGWSLLICQEVRKIKIITLLFSWPCNKSFRMQSCVGMKL